LVLVYRRDYQYDLTLGLSWNPVQNWAVRPQISYTRNDSNSGLNDYDRTDASVTVRRDFK
jgi:opacity protein-like surface antigen